MKNTEQVSLPCGIVRDLLPLYHDAIISEEGRQAVEAHLGACAECSQELQKLNAELPLPEFPPDSKRGFQKMVEKNKRKHKLINVVCFLTGAAVILAGTVYFLRNAMVVKWDSGIFDVKCVHHYQYQNCRYAYAHDEKQDDALFIYMNAPIGGNMNVTHSDGELALTFLHPVWNPVIYGLGDREDVFIVPVEKGDKRLTINGREICEIGEPETAAELPDYVPAFHYLNYCGIDGCGSDCKTENGTITFTVYPDTDWTSYIKWDIDGNLLADTTSGFDFGIQ